MWKPMSLIAVALFAATPASAQQLEGWWTNPKGTVVIKVERCGPAYCGRVIHATAKARENARKSGTPQLIGTRILTGLKPIGEGRYRGQAFVPRHKVRGTATVRQISRDVMQVQGCVVGGMLCDNERWTRVHG